MTCIPSLITIFRLVIDINEVYMCLLGACYNLVQTLNSVFLIFRTKGVSQTSKFKLTVCVCDLNIFEFSSFCVVPYTKQLNKENGMWNSKFEQNNSHLYLSWQVVGQFFPSSWQTTLINLFLLIQHFVKRYKNNKNK